MRLAREMPWLNCLTSFLCAPGFRFSGATGIKPSTGEISWHDLDKNLVLEPSGQRLLRQHNKG